jgi:L-threonylcarbamoyladenylate synthase
LQVLKPNEENIALAGRHLREGGLVAFPTETVYGLGANACDGRAVAALYEAKGRPRFNPLIVHLADTGEAEGLGVFDARARRLAARFWPGPLTLVVPLAANARLSSLVTAGLDTVGLRAPSYRIARAVIAAAGVPVAAPSANRSGRVSPTTAAHVAADFADVEGLILDGGRCPGGLESTVVGLAGDVPVLLRPGGVPRAEIEDVLGTRLHGSDAEDRDSPAAPGMLASHYAPRARLRLEARQAQPGEALLGFGPDAPRETALNLSPSGDLREAAANLFAYLRELDAADTEAIAVMPIPREDLGEAINDRLERAAAPRP